MLFNIFIGLIMVAMTVTIQALGSRYWLYTIAKDFFNLAYDKFKKRMFRFLITTAFLLLLMNLLQAFLWALMYYFLPGITVLKSLEESVYFSLVTFTTLGYGDITIATDHRMLAGIEAINGVLLIGWSTALMFSAIQEMMEKRIRNEKKN